MDPDIINTRTPQAGVAGSLMMNIDDTVARFDEAREKEFELHLRALVLEIVADKACDVFLFGSRARRQAWRASDFDIGIKGLSATEFASIRRRIQDAVEESNILHGVDVVDFDRAGEPFSSVAQKDTIVWKSA